MQLSKKNQNRILKQKYSALHVNGRWFELVSMCIAGVLLIVANV